MNDKEHSSSGRLLVVDDIVENRAILKRLLGMRGFEIVEASDGQSALDAIGQETFDAVLLDIAMPGMNGFEVLKRIRERQSAAALPVIMVTARAEGDDVVQALQLGANDYITKPIDVRICVARLQSQLDRLKVERKLVKHVEELESVNRKLTNEITERERSEALVRHMAQHDSLTGLANRARFREEIVAVLAQENSSSEKHALLFIDLDEFKLINDTLGHCIGDRLLVIVGERLRQSTRECDTVARLGGDEFAVIQRVTEGAGEVEALCNRLIGALKYPFAIDGHLLHIGCTIGIAWAMTDGNDADTLLAHADLALYRAKAEARGSFRFFKTEMNERAQARRQLECDMQEAFDTGQFELHYQPLFGLKESAVTGFEALVRWRHPTRGLISPREFITVAEETGLIIPLSKWILREACQEAKKWPKKIKLAVNLSPIQFRAEKALDDVVEALNSSDLDPTRLELEITESVLLDNDRKTIEALHRLRDMGIRISMDDFGTGYSSLSYLRQFPFDKIKIDQTFVSGVPNDVGSMAIIRAVIGLAGSIGMITTAEGTETAEQLAWLESEGCTEVQGYHISRPVLAKDILPMLGAESHIRRRVA
ncbi:MAG: EAL domain-containing protein [Bradyrhizobium sp.]